MSGLFLGEAEKIFPLQHQHYTKPDNGGENYQLELRASIFGVRIAHRSDRKGQLGHWVAPRETNYGDITGWVLWDKKEDGRRINTWRQIFAGVTNEQEKETFGVGTTTSAGDGSITSAVIRHRDWSPDDRLKTLKAPANPLWPRVPENGYYTIVVGAQEEDEQEELIIPIDQRLVANNSTPHSSIISEYLNGEKKLSETRFGRLSAHVRISDDGINYVPAFMGDQLLDGGGGFFSMWSQGEGGGQFRTQVFDSSGRRPGVFTWGDWTRGGPFHAGHQTNDKHKITTNRDGESVQPMHIQHQFLMYKNRVEDGPLNITSYKKPRKFPINSEVFFGWNNDIEKWDWYCKVPPVYEPWVPWNPPVDKVPVRIPTDVVSEPNPVPEPDLVPVKIPTDAAVVGGPKIGEAFRVNGGPNGVAPAEIPSELRVASLFVGSARDKESQGYGGNFGPWSLDPKPEAEPSLNPQPQPSDGEETFEGPQGAFAGPGGLLKRRAQGRTETIDSDGNIISLADPSGLTAKQLQYGDRSLEVGPPSYGKSPNAIHIQGVSRTKTDGSWDLLIDTFDNGGGSWLDGVPVQSAMQFGPPAELIDGEDDQSADIGPSMVGLYDGNHGGEPTVFGWGTPDFEDGTLYGGPRFVATGSAGSQNLSITATNLTGATRALVTTFNGTLLAADGTTSVPSYGFSSEAGLGMYRGGSSVLGFAAGSSQRMRLTTTMLAPTGTMALGAFSSPWNSLYNVTHYQMGVKYEFSSSPTILSTDEDDYVLPAAPVVRLTSNADVEITGFLAAVAEQKIDVLNTNASSGYGITIKEEDAGSSAANRVITDVGDVSIFPGETATFWYDSTSARWRIV